MRTMKKALSSYIHSHSHARCAHDLFIAPYILCECISYIDVVGSPIYLLVTRAWLGTAKRLEDGSLVFFWQKLFSAFDGTCSSYWTLNRHIATSLLLSSSASFSADVMWMWCLRCYLFIRTSMAHFAYGCCCGFVIKQCQMWMYLCISRMTKGVAAVVVRACFINSVYYTRCAPSRWGDTIWCLWNTQGGL